MTAHDGKMLVMTLDQLLKVVPCVAGLMSPRGPLLACITELCPYCLAPASVLQYKPVCLYMASQGCLLAEFITAMHSRLAIVIASSCSALCT